jgi:hypothetical protein
MAKKEAVKTPYLPSKAMRDKDQKMRFNKAELSLIKAVFADNEDLIFALRKVFLQFPLNETEKEMIKGQVTETVYTLIKKFFLPELDPEAPLFQLTDMINTLSIPMQTKGVEEMEPLIEAKQLEIDYLAQRLGELYDFTHDIISDRNTINLSEMVKVKSIRSEMNVVFVNITARNYILSWVDSNLQQIQFLASQKDGETVEETLERLKKDSNK